MTLSLYVIVITDGERGGCDLGDLDTSTHLFDPEQPDWESHCVNWNQVLVDQQPGETGSSNDDPGGSFTSRYT